MRKYVQKLRQMFITQPSPETSKSKVNNTQHQVELHISCTREEGDGPAYVDFGIFDSGQFAIECTFKQDEAGIFGVICLSLF